MLFHFQFASRCLVLKVVISKNKCIISQQQILHSRQAAAKCKISETFIAHQDIITNYKIKIGAIHETQMEKDNIWESIRSQQRKRLLQALHLCDDPYTDLLRHC